MRIKHFAQSPDEATSVSLKRSREENMMKKRYTEKNDESTSEQTATVGAKRAREDETQEHRKK
jgi:hypothetical protein